MLKLYIGNKNYSSWSMRPWVLLKQAGMPFEEVKVRFDSFEPQSTFKQSLRAVSPTGKVPVLVDDGFASGTRWRSPNTSPRNSPRRRCGPGTRRRARGHAASAPRCTPDSAPCAATAR